MADSPHADAEQALGTYAVRPGAIGSEESVRASRAWWDADADGYQSEHGEFLGDSDFVWCPESLREQDARLLGPAESLVGASVLEVGCGAASCSRWLASQGAHPVGLDLSGGMLRHAGALAHRTGIHIRWYRPAPSGCRSGTGSSIWRVQRSGRCRSSPIRRR